MEHRRRQLRADADASRGLAMARVRYGGYDDGSGGRPKRSPRGCYTWPPLAPYVKSVELLMTSSRWAACSSVSRAR
jgi:hypothetical protein